jgi:hypothetical protein
MRRAPHLLAIATLVAVTATTVVSGATGPETSADQTAASSSFSAADGVVGPWSTGAEANRPAGERGRSAGPPAELAFADDDNVADPPAPGPDADADIDVAPERDDRPVVVGGEGFTPDAADDDEISITVAIPDATEGDEDTTALSAEAAIACGAIERAIEADRIGDIAGMEEGVYEAFPFATSATEVTISVLGADLLDALHDPDLPATLNAFLNACVAAGHGV